MVKQATQSLGTIFSTKTNVFVVRKDQKTEGVLNRIIFSRPVNKMLKQEKKNKEDNDESN